VIAAIVLFAAAATTTAVPSLKALVEAHGGGAGAGGVFVAAHVIGQVLGAALLRRRLMRGGEIRARALVVGALAASAAITVAMALVAAATSQLAALLVLRAADGVAHVLAVMGLLGAMAGEARLRWLGGLLVVGVAAGLGVGTALVGRPVAEPVAAGALLSGLAAVLAAAAVPARVRREPRAAGPSRAPATAVLSVGAMRFAFGVMTVGLPFLGRSTGHTRVVGITLGTMMLASVATLPLVAAAGHRIGWSAVARIGALVLTAALASIAVPGLIGSIPGLGWAPVAGLAAAGIYAAALAAVAAIADAGARTGAVGVVHAAGSAGHAAGALLAGVMMSERGLGISPASTTALLGAMAVGLVGVILAAGRPRGAR
jgi:hypothetical protein